MSIFCSFFYNEKYIFYRNFVIKSCLAKKQSPSKAKNKGKEEKTLTAKDHHKNEKEPTRIGSFNYSVAISIEF